MMKQFYALVFFLVVIFSGYAQVGVGTPMPDSSAQLDIVAKDKGVLIPRIALKDIKDTTTITNGNVESLLVFNTSGTAGLKPGYYYWHIDRWHRVVSSGDLTGGDIPDNIVVYNPVSNQFTYIDENGNSQEINFEEIVKSNETITTLANISNGVYVYTSEDGTETTINVQADVINQFEEIIKNENIVNKITELIKNIGGNVHYDGDRFTYVDENGTTQTINFEEIVKANETVTTLVNNNDGTYTYTSEDGTITTINVPADVINQFEEIIQNENVVNEITELIQNVGGNVYYDGNSFTYIDEAGNTQTINLEEIVKANETVTTLVNNNDGTYTYTSEDGTITTINVPADVINQFEEIIQNENVVNEITELVQNVGGNVYYDGDQFTYIDEAGNTQTINFEEIVKANETVTTLVNNNDGTYTYTSEDGTVTTINVPADVINQFEEIIQNENVVNEITELIQNVGGNVYYDGNQFTYLDENGETQVINFEELVKANETVTTLTDNQDGTFTYTNEDGIDVVFDANTTTMVDNEDGTYTFTNANGDTITVDVPNSVVENITNEGDIFNAIENLIKNIGGNVYYDGNQFTYLDANGETQVINFEELVQANETVTTLTDNQDGTFTYTNEDGIDVVFDANTTTMIDNGDGTYTFTNANGDTITVDVPNSVVENITNEGDIFNAIENLIKNIGGNVYYDGNQFTYLDENGDTQVINFEELVQANETVTTLLDHQDGTFTYTNENGDAVTFDANTTTMVDNGDGTYTFTNANGDTITVDVPSSVVENITNEGDIFNAIENLIKNIGGNVYYDGNQFTYLDENGNTQTINFEELVQANETVTTLVNNNDGTYTYTSEDGTITTINVPADVINQFEEIIQNENVVNEITELIQNVGGNVYYDGNQFTYLDENGETQVINFEELVQANETVTTLTDNQDGTFTYTNEDGIDVVFDANTTTMVDNGDGTYTFTNANGDTITVDVPSSVVENITNEGDIFNAIENLIKNIGGNVYYDGNQFTYLDENGETQVINFEELVQANETVTTLVNNNDGTYTYTSEDGTVTTINVPADVINQFEEIVNNENVYNTLEEIIKNVGGNVYYDGNQFTYLDENGDTQVINFEELVQANETVTTLVDNQDGTFIYTNENGDAVTFDANTTTMADNGDGTYTFTNANGDTITVDVPSSVVENITNEGDIFNAIENLIKNIGGNVYYDGDSFTYIDEAGNTQTINFEELVQANETVTTLTDNQDGTFTYTNENGDAVTFDANTTTMVDNEDGTYTFTNANGDTITVDVPSSVVENITNEGDIFNAIENLIKNIGGNVYYDGNQFTYLDENGDTQVINFEELVKANETVTTLLDNQDGTFTYTNENGDAVTFDANTTTMADNGDGTYTFTNANGDTITVDVPSSVVENITNEGDIFNAIENLIKNIGGNVYYDGNQFTYLDENGETQVINFEELVQANETVTTLTDNQDGTFTYKNEDGIDVVFDANTTTMIDNGDGTYTFTNANGETITVDVPNSVVDNITNEGDIFTAIENLIKNIGGNVYYDGDQFTYLDENGETQTINFEEIVKENETLTVLEGNSKGALTYTDEEDNTTVIKAVMPKFFYMPSIIFDTSTPANRLTRNLHQEYIDQFGTPVVSSAGAATPIPTLEANEVEYYITYYDTDVFANLSIDANGVLTYDVIGNATPTSFMNIVFVVK